MKVSKILFGLLIVVAATSCKKEGCIDPDAINYSSEAKKADNSCTYEGSVVFWFDQSVSQGLISDGATSLAFEVNGQNVESIGTNVFWSVAPNCDDVGSLTITMPLGSNKSSTLTYKIIDQTGWVYWESTATFSANTCESIQLI